MLKNTIGIDEVGRGPWAGPLVAAAVALKPHLQIPGLNDSKLLSSQVRQRLATSIRRQALGIGIGWAPSKLVDQAGLSAATTWAMSQALLNLSLEVPAEIIIDGKFDYLAPAGVSCRPVIKADRKYPSVMAASIIAKVARDNYMAAMGRLYPDYGFARHVGYGTSHHQQCLLAIGPTPLHRLSFKPLAQG